MDGDVEFWETGWHELESISKAAAHSVCHTLEQESRFFHEPLPQLVADLGYILDAFSLQSFSLFQHFSQDSNLVSLEIQ